MRTKTANADPDQLLERVLELAASGEKEKAVPLLHSMASRAHSPTWLSGALAKAIDAGLRDETLPLVKQAARRMHSPVLHGMLGRLYADAAHFDLAAAHYRKMGSAVGQIAVSREGLASAEAECLKLPGAPPTSAPAPVEPSLPAPERSGDPATRPPPAAVVAELKRLREAVLSREREVRALRHELAATQAAARRREEELTLQVRTFATPEALGRAVRAEIEAREQEARQKTEEVVRRALGRSAVECDARLVELLRFAEQTFQTSLHATVPTAAVALQYCAALERALELALAQPFARALDRDGMRERFLQANATRRRGAKREYHQRFLELLDPAREGRAATLGEVSRLLEQHRHPQLAPLSRFLERQFVGQPGLLPALPRFLREVKQKLRDPSAHGRAAGVTQGDLIALRETLMHAWEGATPGLLARLGAAARAGLVFSR